VAINKREAINQDIRALQRVVNGPNVAPSTRRDIDAAVASMGLTPVRHATDPTTGPRPAAAPPATSCTSRAPATTPSRPRSR
jgi:hypothetical protein